MHHVIPGTNAPAGSAVQPLGILWLASMLSAASEAPAEVLFCCAAGNTARIRRLDCGIPEPGRAADFVFMDRAQHSAGADLLASVRSGDLPSAGMVVIDGLVRCGRSRNTRPAKRALEVVA